jgi:glycosyltransferase involved in cell wall biosynthesis
VLARLGPILARRGHEVAIVTADDPARVEGIGNELRTAGVEFVAGGPPTGPVSRGPAVSGEIDRRLTAGIDIVHIHGVWQQTPHYGAAAARKAGVAYIFRPCGMLDPWCLNQGRVKKRLFLAVVGRRHLNGAAALHFTTTTEQRLVEPLRLTPPGFVIPNGIDWSEFETPPPRGRFRERYGIGDRPLVVILSRLHPKKGLDLLSPAFASGAPREARLALVGPGEDGYVDSLRTEAKRLGVDERVIFTGMVEGAARLEALTDADLFCLPSYQENFGVAVIEALGVGTPVLISDQVNVCDEVRRAEVGVVVPCDGAALAREMSALLSNPSRRAEMGRRARPWIERTFRWDRVAEQIEEMYETVRRRD